MGQRTERFLPTLKKSRTFLEVDELSRFWKPPASWIGTSSAPAGSGGGRACRLGLTGFRISELCDMPCSQVDLARARFKIADAKTEKGVREVEMTLGTAMSCWRTASSAYAMVPDGAGRPVLRHRHRMAARQQSFPRSCARP